MVYDILSMYIQDLLEEMMMTKENYEIGKRIQQRRKQLGYTQQDLAKKIQIDHHQTISDIERGVRELKASELANIAKTLHISVSDLLRSAQSADPSPVLWREKPQDRTIKEARFRERCEQYHFLEELLSKNPTSNLACHVNSPLSNVTELSERVRDEMGLGRQPAASLKQTLEEEYLVKIWFMDLEDGGAGACTKDKFGYGILINAADAPWRMNFSLAHELFHLLTWDKTLQTELGTHSHPNTRIERKANQFAANLLLPVNSVMSYFKNDIENHTIKYSDFIEFARRYQVSTEALVWRLYNLDLIPENVVDKILNDETFRNMDKSSMQEYWKSPLKIPERFVRLTGLALMRGKISKTKAADLLDTSLFDLQTTFNRYGMTLTNDQSISLST